MLVSIEDGVRVGGIGTRIRQDLRAAGVDTAVTELGLPDEFLEHGGREYILEQAGLTPQAIARDVVAQVLGTQDPGRAAAAGGRADRTRTNRRRVIGERCRFSDSERGFPANDRTDVGGAR